MASGCFAYTAFAIDALANRIVGWESRHLQAHPVRRNSDPASRRAGPERRIVNGADDQHRPRAVPPQNEGHQQRGIEDHPPAAQPLLIDTPHMRCQALINQPMILLGDERTGARDSPAASEIMDILGELNAEGTTIMLVTHDAKIAARTDRVLYMVDGRIVGDRHQGRYTGTNLDQRTPQ
jgi:hypothetical protein